MTEFDWNEYRQTGDWITFSEVGDSVVGVVVAVRTGQDFNGRPCPELVLDVDGSEKTLTAGQVMLRAALAAEQPQAGDRVAIVYSGVGEARPGKAPAKLFDVTVQRGGSNGGGGVSAADLLT